MRGIHLAEELSRIEFAQRAAKAFAEHPQYMTFGDVEKGGYLALRWGLGGDCVLVVKLDEFDEPVNFHQLIRDQGGREEQA